MIPEESRNLRPYSLGGLPLDSHDHVWMLIFLADFLGSGILVSFKVATAKFFQSTLLQKLVLCQLSSFLFLTDFTRWLVSDLEKIIGASVNPTASILYKGKFTYIYSKNNPFMQENTPYIYMVWVSAAQDFHLQVYVISDGVPISRREICTAAVQSKHFAGKAMPTFEVCEKLPSELKGPDVFLRVWWKDSIFDDFLLMRAN